MLESPELTVRIAGIVNESVCDGPGLRVVVFFQGCRHHCANCCNPQSWDFAGGTVHLLDEFCRNLPDSPLIKGITLSGGDPFFQPLAALRVARAFHQQGKDVWAYTGFLWEDLLNHENGAVGELLQECDVIVDGPFQYDKRDPNLIFRGSANQRLILVKDSLAASRVVEYDTLKYT